MKISVISVGKTVSKNISELENEYFGRLKHYCNCENFSVAALKNRQNFSAEESKIEEGKLLQKVIEENDFVVLLDEKGSEFTSLEFAQWIEKKQFTIKKMVFIIGGAFGFSQEIYDRKNFMISLSKMTFSHQIVRAIFAEQLYRAMSIIKGEKYHHC
jgi:23S rRNA (pseudouridine1915-N3)-methyltransferase